MTPLTPFVNLLFPYVPGATDIALMYALRRCAIEFCMRSMVWKTLVTADMVASQTVYTVAADTDAVVSKVLAVSVLGGRLEPIQFDELAQIDNWNMVMAAMPTQYYLSQPGVVNLWPIPTMTVTSGLLFQIVEQPSMTCATVPDFVYNQYGQAMVDGALAVLMSTPGKEWTNPEMAAWHRGEFEQQIAMAMQQASEAFGRTPVRSMAIQ